MRVAIIGRTEALYDAAQLLHRSGHSIVCIITAKAAPEYSKREADFEQLAAELNIPFVHSVRIENELPILQAVQAEIGLSVNYPAIIPETVTATFPLGILNAHGGDLPRYRGNACQAWAILNGETRIGLCVHKMVGGELDSGNIIAREYLPIDHTTKVTTVHHWMNERVPEMFLLAVNLLQINSGFVLERQSTDPKNALRCYPRHPQDGRIDWAQTALDVLRLINACNKPYAGAFCEYDGERLIIWHAELVSEWENFCAVHGQVTRIGEGYIEVACGEGKLRLMQVEVAGLVGSPNDWVKSIRKRLT